MDKIILEFENSELEMLQMAADMYTEGNIEPLLKSLITAGYDHLENLDNYLPAEYQNKKRPSSIFYIDTNIPMNRKERRELVRKTRRGKL